MSATNVLHYNNLYRVGGVSAIVGVAFGIVFAMLGPMNLDSHDIDSVLQMFASDKGKLQFHGFGITVGALLILGGFVALRFSLSEGSSAVWARLGLVVAIVKAVFHLIGAMMGGSVMPAVAESYLQVSPETAQAAMLVGMGSFIFYEALLAPTFLTFSVTLLLFAVALLKSTKYPAWLGWAAVVAGLYTAIGGAAFLFAGPLGAADIMNMYVPAFMLGMVWVFVMGIYLLNIQKIQTE